MNKTTSELVESLTETEWEHLTAYFYGELSCGGKTDLQLARLKLIAICDRILDDPQAFLEHVFTLGDHLRAYEGWIDWDAQFYTGSLEIVSVEECEAFYREGFDALDDPVIWCLLTSVHLLGWFRMTYLG